MVHTYKKQNLRKDEQSYKNYAAAARKKTTPMDAITL